MERVISRADLLAEEPSPPSSPDLPAIKSLQEFDFVHHETLPDAHDQEQENDAEDGLEFQLFAPPAGKTENASGIAKIRLDSPDLTNAEPGLVNPNRDPRYYFTSGSSPEEQQNFEAAAMSGQDILNQSRRSWPGMAYPWKVLHLPKTKKQQKILAPSDALYTKLIGHQSVQKRTRPGKKARVAVRTKLVAAKTKQEEKQKAAELKEAEEREKRTRRNREKKVKKKNREKAKKAEANGTTDEVEAEENDQHDED
ncbi:hypothetical protein CB0940_03073 [Cercospora beticola]|uniref:Uncharacterized protein n=1 Tax=Cercospora beticola TaxID=122368 RepID=A0A2G5I1I0_CERBT|nr:hypothetical protein CB0940_03073 [Cercospora beticola]PIA98639.1 hypothetical protein CB0940_03073 [Cercospora beticola]WPB00239.1 hypothetical protein RHO25_004858 [Cercospora beticola]CAK1361566.1 unnamed protein product [Cercospora beticola]